MADQSPQAIIALARQEANPTDGEIERLYARLAAPVGPDDGGGSAAPPVTKPATRALRWIAAVVLCVGAVAAIVMTRPDAPPTKPATATQPTTQTPPPADPREESVVEPTASAVATAPSNPPEAVATKEDPPRPQRTRLRQQDASETKAVVEGLSEELALLKRTRAALRDEAWATVLRLTAEHAERFASGSFGEEFAALDTIARCATATPEAAADLARRYRKSGRATFQSRVAAACERPAK